MPDDREEWQHSPRGMMEYFQASKHRIGESIADLVDNALDAGAERVEVDIGWLGDDEKPYIAIFDDGDGMDAIALSNAMSLAERRDDRPKEDLGLFGIGMKISSLAQADEVTVFSKKKHGSEVALRRISAPTIRSNNTNEILRFPTESEIWKYVERRFREEGWSTVVLLEDLHKIERTLRRPDKKIKTTFREELGRLQVHLGLVYERVLNKGRGPEIALSHNGRKMPIEPVDPFMKHERDGRFGSIQREVLIPTESEGTIYQIPVTFHIIPHTLQRKDTRRCNRVNRGYLKANDMQGIYYYRNQRLIKYGGWEGLLGETNDEHGKLGKIEVNVPASLHRHFGLDPNKTAFDLPGDFAMRLRQLADEKCQWGQIANGDSKSFMAAAKHRYDNEGKKAKAGSKKEKAVTLSTTTTAASSLQTGSATVNTPAAATKKKRAPKPKQVVVNIEEQETEVLVRIDRNRPGADDLLRIIREWEVE